MNSTPEEYESNRPNWINAEDLEAMVASDGICDTNEISCSSVQLISLVGILGVGGLVRIEI